jgi:hypothetical protein
MHVKGKLDQIKIKTLKSMVNEENEIIFFMEKKEKWIFFFVLPSTMKFGTFHWPLIIGLFSKSLTWNISLTTKYWVLLTIKLGTFY